MKTRIGTLYRNEIIKYFDQVQASGPVLDIGCHDGELLKKINASVKVGIDIEMKKVDEKINFVCADANFLPFQNEIFEKVFAMDVIEHIENDHLLPSSIHRVLSPHGSFFLTTPSKSIRLFPWFLTNFISKKWGHIYRLGYTKMELEKLFSGIFHLNIYEWNAKWWRVFYLFIRSMVMISQNFTEFIIKKIFYFDSKSQNGVRGYLIMEGLKKNG
jgi:SAM-dependent methyltransferase